MSKVSNAILCGLSDLDLFRVNEVLKRHEVFSRFTNCEESGCSKALEARVSVAAFNYVGADQLLEMLGEVKFSYPEEVRLFFCDQSDEGYAPLSLRPRR